MLVGNLNFLTAYMLCRGRLIVLRHDSELRFVAIFVPLSVLFWCFCSCAGSCIRRLGKGVRVAIFETVSCITTTGFSTVPYSNWNAFGILMLIAFMIVGGGTGSTAGGMKQYRAVLLAKSIFWDIRRALLPGTAVVENHVWHSGERDYIDDARLRQATAFASLYLLTFLIGTAILTAHGYSLSDSLFEFASAQGTVGLSVGVTSPDAPALVLWADDRRHVPGPLGISDRLHGDSPNSSATSPNWPGIARDPRGRAAASTFTTSSRRTTVSQKCAGTAKGCWRLCRGKSIAVCAGTGAVPGYRERSEMPFW